MSIDPKTFLERAAYFNDKIVQNRRDLHRNAETGFDIPVTLEFVRNELEMSGIKWDNCGRAGITATIGGKRPGKTFMLRADMDGLPIKEESGETFSSPSGNMHACGHDMHTAMLLGAAGLLKEHENDINGTVKLMFQPAEELFEGSEDMIKAGLLENPHVDAALMIHVVSPIPLETGTVVVSALGISAPGADYFTVDIQGKGCHGSMPNTGIDPITAAAHIITGLQEISARELAIGEKAIITIGSVKAGNAANVIPDTAQLKGSIRTFDDNVRSFVIKRIEEISSGIASAFRCAAKTYLDGGCPSLLNDKALSECAERYAAELLGKEKALSAAAMEGSGASGSEDFAFISRQVPSIMLALAAGNPKDGFCYPQHHPKVRFDEKALPTGCAIYAYIAMRWLEEN